MAAGDLAVATAPRHYVVRTSWVVGDGNNFVRTMQSLAQRGVSPSVVDDQIGRLTFTSELSRATAHLVSNEAPFGTYNVTNSGPAMSWADLARAVFERSGRSPDDVTGVSTADYSAGKGLAPRPAMSSLSLQKLRSSGFEPEDALIELGRYLLAE
jgi:dTDP-4-dehydrorhamnose reductase